MGARTSSVWPAGGDPVVVDGNVEMPGRGADPARFGRASARWCTDYGGGVTMMAGHGSVATPGIVPAFAVAAERYAALPWARLVQPAAAAARAYPMGAAASRYLAFVADTLFADDAEARALVTGDGGPLLRGGEERDNTPSATPSTGSPPRVRRSSRPATSAGRWRRAWPSTTGWSPPTTWRRTSRSSGPPTSRRRRLDRRHEPAAGGRRPDAGGDARRAARRRRRGDWTWDDVIEIQRAVLSYRTSVHDFSRDLEADGIDLLARVGEHGLTALRGSSSTANVSAVDSDGNACTITMSSGYSAGLVIPGTGILLNNALGEVELNRLGIHALSPGTRLASNMAPTTARTDGGRVLAIGSPGADRITTALMLVLGQGCLHDRDLRSAIAAPRIHLRLVDDELRRRARGRRGDPRPPSPGRGCRATSTPSRTCTSAGSAPPPSRRRRPPGSRRRPPRGRDGRLP